MREIKFRYRHRSTKSDFVAVDIVTIEELYRGHYMAGLSDRNHWELLSRDEFTGLKDKNGKEIYDGDILEFNSKGYYAKVVWLEETGCWGTSNGNPLGRAAAMSDLVGNIYENPELLK